MLRDCRALQRTSPRRPTEPQFGSGLRPQGATTGGGTQGQSGTAPSSPRRCGDRARQRRSPSRAPRVKPGRSRSARGHSERRAASLARRWRQTARTSWIPRPGGIKSPADEPHQSTACRHARDCRPMRRCRCRRVGPARQRPCRWASARATGSRTRTSDRSTARAQGTRTAANVHLRPR